MSAKSEKWKLENAFFLNDKGRRQYNKICNVCKNDCKQSFKAKLITCPKFTRKQALKSMA